MRITAQTLPESSRVSDALSTAGAMAVGKKPAAAPVKGKKKQAAFVIDCSKPVEDKIMKIGEFEKFLVDKIKVDNKTGVFLGSCCHCRGSPLPFHNYFKAIEGKHAYKCLLQH